MKRRNVAKGFLGSTAKQIACLSLAASVVASPLASYADTASETAVDKKMAPVSTVSEKDVLNILVPVNPTSTNPEEIASPKAVFTDISGKPAVGSEPKAEAKELKPAARDGQKAEGRMARMRKMASRLRVRYDKKQIASADKAAEAIKSNDSKTEVSESKPPVAADAKQASAETAVEPTQEKTSQSWNESTDAAADATKTVEPTSAESAPVVNKAESNTAESEAKPAESAQAAGGDVSADASTIAPVSEAAGVPEEAVNSESGVPIAFGLSGTLKDLEAAAKLSPDGIMVVDNDEAVEQNDHLEYEEMPLDEGKQNIKVGARFPVVISSAINSKTAKKGDRFEARLKYDLKIGDRLIAKKGSVVRGHLDYCLKARTILHSLVSPERWYRNSGCIGLAFDEIVNEKGEHIPCVAAPARAGRVIKNKAEGRELGVNHNGQVVGPWAQQLRYKAVRVGLNFAMAPAGVFSFGAMPVALGAIGAVNPNFAFGKPVGLNVRHRRLKGFAWGFLSGIPGSWLIEDTTVKGQEAIIKPGDEFYAAFKQEFNGEPETDASIMAGASTKVRGQVVNEKPDSKKK
ncbi:MAG TPA: hypothetical protein PKZ32_01810 [Candidatus Melainabacteria bacterium]|nr:hypothetical protein [Candidatus Melainabacteria bacterium]